VPQARWSLSPRKGGRSAPPLVSAKDHAIRALAELKGKRVAVQYETPPQNLLAEGNADAAFIWGPVAGWLNKTNELWRALPRPADRRQGPVLRRGDRIREDVVEPARPGQRRPAGLQRTIENLAAKYGVPADPPIKLGSAPAPIRLASIDPPTRSDASTAPVAEPSAPAVRVADATGTATTETISAGKEIFNGTCAHCHGPDAIQSERRINLRLLHDRYGDDMRAKFWTTVHDGRLAKGMPAWKEVFTDDQFESIYAYLLTVQTAPE
jgi:polar amino acid transport system substrate-binding protein